MCNRFWKACVEGHGQDGTPAQLGARHREDVIQLYKHLMKSIFGKAALAAVALSGILLFAGTPSAKANDWDDCNRRVTYAEFRLHQSIVYFGYYSPQAAYWRHERHEAYERLERYRRQEWREREWR